jgi:predicted phage baseplate assembly protein
VTLRGEGETWLPRRDLLTSSRFAPEFVVETEDGAPPRLRFGDGILGRRPAAGTTFRVRHRAGNGAAGNVGAEALCALVPRVPGVTVRNPIAARGGVDPEPVRQARLQAPHAFRTQERAVTESDYAEAAQRHPDVQRAAATRRWTGSWHTMYVTIDRRGGRPVDTPFETEMRAFLERFRMAGGDLEIDAPRFVPLDITLRLCVDAQAHRAAVQQSLQAAFAAGARPDGTIGFFHPDRYTFGQPVVLSQVMATALDVPGVSSIVDVVRFQRQGEASRGEIERGFIGMHRLEIARLDNDPSVRERGRLTFLLEGGR